MAKVMRCMLSAVDPTLWMNSKPPVFEESGGWEVEAKHPDGDEITDSAVNNGERSDQDMWGIRSDAGCT